MSDEPTVTQCPSCGQDVVQPPNASAEVSATRPAKFYCPVCGRQYPEDGSCDYGHPNVPQLVPLDKTEDGHAVDPATGQGWSTAPAAPIEPAAGSPVAAVPDPPPPAEPVYGGTTDGEPGTEGYGRFGGDHVGGGVTTDASADPAPDGTPCPTCQGKGVVPAPPPAGEVICPTCSGTGKAPDYGQAS